MAAGSSPENKAAPGDVESQWPRWLTDQLAQLLAATSTLAGGINPQRFVRNFKRCVAASVPGCVQRLAQEMEHAPRLFFGWIHHRQHPQLSSLAEVCYHLGVSVLDMLTVQPGQDDDSLPPETGTLRPARISVETEVLSHRLGQVLNDPYASPGSAAQVVRQLGITPALIKGHCPEQYQQILQRNERHQQAQQQARYEKLSYPVQPESRTFGRPGKPPGKNWVYPPAEHDQRKSPITKFRDGAQTANPDQASSSISAGWRLNRSAKVGRATLAGFGA